MADQTDLTKDGEAEDIAPDGTAGEQQRLPDAAHDRHLPASAFAKEAPGVPHKPPIEVLPVPNLWGRSR